MFLGGTQGVSQLCPGEYINLVSPGKLLSVLLAVFVYWVVLSLFAAFVF